MNASEHLVISSKIQHRISANHLRLLGTSSTIFHPEDQITNLINEDCYDQYKMTTLYSNISYLKREMIHFNNRKVSTPKMDMAHPDSEVSCPKADIANNNFIENPNTKVSHGGSLFEAKVEKEDIGLTEITLDSGHTEMKDMNSILFHFEIGGSEQKMMSPRKENICKPLKERSRRGGSPFVGAHKYKRTGRWECNIWYT